MARITGNYKHGSERVPKQKVKGRLTSRLSGKLENPNRPMLVNYSGCSLGDVADCTGSESTPDSLDDCDQAVSSATTNHPLRNCHEKVSIRVLCPGHLFCDGSMSCHRSRDRNLRGRRDGQPRVHVVNPGRSQHQTNDGFWSPLSATQVQSSAGFQARERPDEAEFTRLRQASFEAALSNQRRENAQSVAKSAIVILIDLIEFFLHWQIARRARQNTA